MKKALPVFLSLLLAASCVACGKSPSESTQGPSNSSTAEKVELNCAVFAGSEAEENYWDRLSQIALDGLLQFFTAKVEQAAANDYFLTKISEKGSVFREDR